MLVPVIVMCTAFEEAWDLERINAGKLPDEREVELQGEGR